MWTTYRNFHGRYAVLMKEGHKFRYLLRSNGGKIDVIKTTATDFAAEGFKPIEDPLAALRFAHTFAPSELFKTRRATRAIEEIFTMDLNALSMTDLVAEFNRMSGKKVARFSDKKAAIKAIEKQRTLVNTAAAEPEESAEPTKQSEQSAVISTNQENDEMATTKRSTRKNAGTKAKPASKARTSTKANNVDRKATKRSKAPTADAIERAKKVCNSTRGAAAAILKLLREGREYDKIAEKIGVPRAHVVWYQSMRRKAGEKVVES